MTFTQCRSSPTWCSRFSQSLLCRWPGARLISTHTSHDSSPIDAKRAGDISNAFVSLSGELRDAEPLHDRYRLRKEALLGDARSRQKWQAAWEELLQELSAKAARVKQQKDDYVPVLDLEDVQRLTSGWHGSRDHKIRQFSKEYKERGVAVIRNVIPREEVLAHKEELKEYISRNQHRVKGFPADNKQVYEIYWSKAQMLARAHPRTRLASQFLLSFWHDTPASQRDGELAVHQPSAAAVLPVAYTDRLRMRMPGDATFALGPHVDGGSVERWEAGGYQRADGGRGTYAQVWEGQWQQHDPWYLPGRVGAVSDMYYGTGACSVFRAAQGWLAMSSIAPGEGHLKVNPMLKETLAYWLMRPFFEPVQSFEVLGDRWLDASNWRLERNASAKVHGATPGFAQEINAVLHPHLQLENTMIHMPPVEPGDYVVWHSDTVHAVDAIHAGKQDSSVLYIPVCPWTVDNLKFSQRQLRAFASGVAGPDYGTGEGESQFEGRLQSSELLRLLDEQGRWTTGICGDDVAAASDDAVEDLYRRVLHMTN